MTKQEILNRLKEMEDESYKVFKGSNEAMLDFRENVASWIFTIDQINLTIDQINQKLREELKDFQSEEAHQECHVKELVEAVKELVEEYGYRIHYSDYKKFEKLLQKIEEE